MKLFEGLRPQIYIHGAKLRRDLGALAPWMSVDFYALVEDKKPALHVQGVDLAGLRLTRDAETVEFWVQFEVENNASVHAFVKEYAFTRAWAEFKQRAGEIAAEQAKAAKT